MWDLAAFEFGSGLRFAVVLPVHAANGRVDFDIEKVRFEYPPIDPGQTAKDVIRKILD